MLSRSPTKLELNEGSSNDLKRHVKFKVTKEVLMNLFYDVLEGHCISCICILYKYVCILIHKKLGCLLNLYSLLFIVISKDQD